MRIPLVLLFLLAIAVVEPAASQDGALGAAVGYRMEGLDLAVFDPRGEPASEASPSENPPPTLRDAVLGQAVVPDVRAEDTPFTIRQDTLQDGSDEDRQLNPWRLAALTGASTGAALFVMDHQRRRWWDDRSPTFRVQNDWEYVRFADKLGHFYSAALLTRGYRGSLRWAGVSEDQARLWGAVGGFTNMLYYEVLDGFGVQWGFSPGDFVFNTAGVFWAAAQADEPALDAVRLKMSYAPSGWEGKNPIDDYAGQTYWLTANLHRLAPDGAKRVLPAWLNVAVGYGAREQDEFDFLTQSLVYVGLDLAPAGLPIRGRLWEAMLPVLRHIHFPFPAVRITPDPAFIPFAF